LIVAICLKRRAIHGASLPSTFDTGKKVFREMGGAERLYNNDKKV